MWIKKIGLHLYLHIFYVPLIARALEYTLATLRLEPITLTEMYGIKQINITHFAL